MQRLRVGDFVQVIAGCEKGKRGKVTKLLSGNGRVLIEGLNMVTRHERPSQSNNEGARIRKEAPLHISNVMLIDADSDKPTRIKLSVDEDGNRERVAVSGAALKQG